MNLFQRKRRVSFRGYFCFQNMEEIIYRRTVIQVFKCSFLSLLTQSQQFLKWHRQKNSNLYILNKDQLQSDMKSQYFLAILIAMALANTSISPQNFTKLAKSANQQNIYSKVHTMGKTVNNNQLLIYTVTKFPYEKLSQLQSKQAVLINSYMHAREPYSLELIFKLYSNVIHHQMAPSLNTFLETGVLIFYPFVNADGFRQYLKKGANKQSIRKNFNLNNLKCQYGSAGVDINRNFDSSFGTVPTSTNPCNEEYRGLFPFSEKQAQVFKEIFNIFKVVIAIDIHSYGNEWIYPYASDASQHKIKNHPLNNIYNQVVAQFRSSNYKIQSCFQSLGYIADGVYIDWALDQGAFSLAYQIGRNFNADSDIAQQIQKALNEFDKLFEFLDPKIVGQQIGATILLRSRSILPLKLNITFESTSVQGLINPGQFSSFAIPSKSSSVRVFVGKYQVLSSKLFFVPQPMDSKLIISLILFTLVILFCLIYKLGKVDQDELKRPQFRPREHKDVIHISYEQIASKSAY